MPSFQCSILPLHEFRKRRKNYVAYVKNPLCRCRSHLPLCHNCRSVANRIESYFCRSAVGGRRTAMERRFQQFRSRAQWQRQLRNGRTATAQRNGETTTAERQNWTLETRHNASDCQVTDYRNNGLLDHRDNGQTRLQLRLWSIIAH